MEEGTIKELNLKPGDVVAWHKSRLGDEWQNDNFHGVDDWVVQKDGGVFSESLDDGFGGDCNHIFRIVSRASDTPKLWRDMTDAEKGALLLAHHKGKVIEVLVGDSWMKVSRSTSPLFSDFLKYRVKPEPVRETFTHKQWVSMHEESSRGSFSLLFGPARPDDDVKGQTAIETVNGKPVKVIWEADSQS